MAGLHFLLQADHRAPERLPYVISSSCSLACSIAWHWRLDVVLLLDRRGVRHISVAFYADSEQPHGRGLERVLRYLRLPPHLGRRVLSGWRFAAAGFFAAFAAANELPALCSAAIALLPAGPSPSPRDAVYFVPAALIPIAAFLAAQYAVFGELKVAYESFGTDEYLYEGSLWKTPLDLDAFNDHPEPYAVYFFHMTLGHHGVLSLTPIFLFSAWGAARLIKGGGRFDRSSLADGPPMVALAYLTTVLTFVVLAFTPGTPRHGTRRLDPGPTLAVLDDSALAPYAAERESSRARPDTGFAGWQCSPSRSRSCQWAMPFAIPGPIPGSSTHSSIWICIP